MTPPSPAADGLAAALLDSGGVLMRPIGGRWNPRLDFDEIVLSRAPHLTADQLLAAIAAGDQWMTALSTTPHYGDYLRVVLRHLGVPANQAWSRLGGIDMPVNNAGIGMRTVNRKFMTQPQGFWEVPVSGFRAHLASQYRHSSHVGRSSLPPRLHHRRGP